MPCYTLVNMKIHISNGTDSMMQALLEKLMVVQLVKNIPTFYGT